MSTPLHRLTARFLSSGIALLICLLSPLAAQQEDPLYGEDLVSAERYLTKGELARAANLYDEVLADWEDLEGSEDAPKPATVRACRVGLARIALRQGRYADAVEAVDVLRSAPGGADLPAVEVLTDALLASGRWDRAARELDLALKDAQPDDTSGSVVGLRLRRARLRFDRGERDSATADFRALAELGRKASSLSAATATHIAHAHFSLGGRDNLVRASGLLRDALNEDPDLAAARVLYARLRYVAYGEWENAESGESVLEDVLERNGEVEAALLLLYELRRDNIRLNPAKTQDFLERALQVNPRSVPGLLARGISLVDDRRFADGERVLDEALEIHERHRGLLAQRAVVAHLRGQDKAAEEFRSRAEAGDPLYSGVDLAYGDRLVKLYRFEDALPYYQLALDRVPDDVAALEGMGRALVYSGRGEEAAVLLRRAKDLEPGYVDPWRNNVIAVQELLDEEYERIETEGFLFLLHQKDREVLERYLVPFHQEARRDLCKKYGVTPDGRVRVEVFRGWDDFSVRTIGFRGFTALGACFGPMITLVSPVDGDLRQNDFMWTATVWHEYTHVLTLELSDSRVPRWLTEGFSVHEERARNRTWERGMDRELLDAWHNGTIPPVTRMNRLFRGPRILFGYYLGGEIVTYLAEKHGFEKVTDMLRGYAKDLSTERIFQNTFGYDTSTFNAGFREWLEARTLKRLRIVPRLDDRAIDRKLIEVTRDPDDLETRVELAWAFVLRGVEVDAASQVREVVRRDPDHPGIALVRAELARRREQFDEAVRFYELGFDGGADDFDSRRRYAQVLMQQGNFDAAIEQFLAAKRCWPRCTDQNTAPELQLARLYRQLGREDEAMLELRTFCRRTARAFQPRLQLAEYARENGDRAQEADLLWEAVQIDPFMRRVHVELGDAYVELGRLQEAVREYEVALAVLPEFDRGEIGKPPTERLRADSPEFLDSQADVRVRLALSLRQVGRDDRARQELELAIQTAPRSDAADRARELLGN